ncbi:MAG: DUF3426 domain-containing protein [Proteobacteria bacterium]|nr:DUF3426 domain-containing protein [Pseudomonadota bacterium]
MALATRCPYCQTTFKVAQDQLKLRSGLVRCGTCREVFNGIEHLVKPDIAATNTTPAAVKPTLPVAPPPSATPVAPITRPAPPAPPAVSTPVKPVITTNPPIPAPPVFPPTLFQLPEKPPVLPQVDFSALDEPPIDITTNLAPPAFAPTLPSLRQDTEKTAPPPPLAKIDLSPAIPPVAATVNVAEPVATGRITNTTPPAPLAPLLPKQEAAPQTNDVPTPPATTIVVEAAPAREPLPALHVEPEPIPAPVPTPLAEPEEISHAEAETEEMAATDEPEKTEETEEPDDESANSAEIEEADDSTSDHDEPDFVTRDRQRQRTRRIVRNVMALGSLFLLLSLLLQGAYTFRDRLAAWFPQAKPALAQLCQLANCQVKLPAQIEMVTIESNELQTLAADKNTFMLNLLLRNHGNVIQAWPHIELTLNDADENALARRILLPRDYLPPTQDSSKGFPANAEQTVKVRFELAQLKASGYRVYLFYP